MRGIYAIVDIEILARAKIDPITFAKRLLVATPCALQLRAKTATARETIALLEALHPLCAAAGVPLVANDRVDLALATRCDLVHLGQDDAPIDLARAFAPQLGVGLSTHTPEQVLSALASRPAYVAYGPIFATASKPNHEPAVGLAGLAAARKIISSSASPNTPLVAIGGISAENAALVSAHADAIAVIGALVGSDPAAQLRALQVAAAGAS